MSNSDDFVRYPPVLCNSFPKSGTHLLLQLLRALPSVRYYGSFLASMPSVTFRERSRAAHLRRIARIVPGEVVPAHLFYHPDYATALQDQHCIHVFIYRDPRDVAVSEAHYLTYMNRWHRLHSYFRQELASMDERVLTSINGVPRSRLRYHYPDIGERFRRYEPWLGRSDVLAVKFEDLMGQRRVSSVRQLVEEFNRRSGATLPVEEQTERLLAAVDPGRSHTFRKGEAGGWREHFTATHCNRMKDVAGDLLIRLGYEADYDW